MEENLKNLQKVLIIFVDNQVKDEEYYFDNQRKSLGDFMDEGWGHFYNPLLERWEFINMQHILKVSYGNS